MSAPRFCQRCGAPLEPHVEEGRTRLRCAGRAAEGGREAQAPCGFVHYGNPTPVVAAIVQHGDDVILVRNHGWPPTWFALVTGFLEAGETPQEGVLRELSEELGLEGTIRGLVGVYAFPQRNEVIIAYHVEVTGEPVLGAELEAMKRVPIAKLKPWPFATGDAVRDWLASRR
ncbi:MAG: NUDIX hydrolase [Sandaracinaceae bacterium]|nr:NUDIX hydrolase [Sandaracinaceae bacterium]